MGDLFPSKILKVSELYPSLGILDATKRNVSEKSFYIFIFHFLKLCFLVLRIPWTKSRKPVTGCHTPSSELKELVLKTKPPHEPYIARETQLKYSSNKNIC
jgi:hypothetical protein